MLRPRRRATGWYTPIHADTQRASVEQCRWSSTGALWRANDQPPSGDNETSAKLFVRPASSARTA